MGKRLLVVLLALLYVDSVNAQAGKVDMSKYIDSIYVYKVSDSDLEYYYHSYYTHKPNLLTADNYVCSYSSRETIPQLPAGNYCLVSIDFQSKDLQYKFYKTSWLNHALLRTNTNNEVYFFDDYGNPNKNIEIEYKSSKIRFDSITHTYKLPKKIDKDYTTTNVTYNGFNHSYYCWKGTHYNDIDNNTSLHRFIKHKEYTQNKHLYCKVGDTIRIRETIRQQPYVYLNVDYDYRNGSLIDTLYPGKNKLFSYDIIVTEEFAKEGRLLAIKITNEVKSSYYVMPLRYYEYKCVSAIYDMKVSIDTTRHFTSKPPVVSMFIEERDNKKADSHFIILEAEVTSVGKVKSSSVFIPRVLFRDTLAIELSKEMRVPIPTHKLPPADLSYKLSVQLVGDRGNIVSSHSYNMQSISSKEVVDMFIKKDMLHIEKINENASSVTSDAVLFAYVYDRILKKTNIKLPYAEKVNPAVSKYWVTSGEAEKELNLYTHEPECLIDYSISFSKDSAHISLQSPYGIPFWYTVWKNKKIIRSAHADTKAGFSLKSKKKDSYVLRLEHLWGGDLVELQTPLTEKPDTAYSKQMKKVDYFQQNLRFSGEKANNYKTPITADFIAQRMPLLDTSFLNPVHASIPKADYLNKVADISTSYYRNARLNISYANTHIHQPRFTILRNNDVGTEKHIHEKYAIYKASTTSIPVDVGISYTLFVVADSLNVYSNDMFIEEDGYEYLTVDMRQANRNSSIDTLLNELGESKSVLISITDRQGYPIVFATIIVEGTQIVTTSDIDGNATLMLPSSLACYININYIGTREQRVLYKGEPILRVIMEDEPMLLE